jgi:hypothetical protein
MSSHRRVRLALRGVSAALCVWLIAGLGACYSVEALPESRRVLDGYFDALRDDDLEAAMERYHPSFFDERSRADWREKLALRGSRIGGPREYRLHRRKVFYGVKEAGAGTYVTLGYSIRYERATTEETFILYRGSERTQPVITRHRLESTHYADGAPG